MRHLVNKLRIIYLPFLFIAAGCLVGYSFLNWLLLIKWGLLSLNEELINIWLPVCLPGIPIFIWLRPRIRTLRARKPGGFDLRGLFWYASWIAIAAPVVIAQDYLATATGKLTSLAQISQIEQVPRTKYYMVQAASFDKAAASVATKGNYSGRYNGSFNMAVYITCPIEDSDNTSHGHVWMGTVYRSQISGHLPDDERESQFRAFFDSSLADYQKLDLGKFSYLERLGLSDDGREFEAAVKRNNLYQPGTPEIVLEAHEGNFSDRNGNKLAWIFGSFGIGAAVCFLILLAAPIDSKEMNGLLSGQRPKEKVTREQFNKTDLETLRFLQMAFVPGRFVVVTPLIVDINIAVFIWMVLAGLGVISFDSSNLLAWGANFRPAVLHGEYWRLATSLFVHGGVMHLLGNLITLFLVGIFLETRVGHLRFLICYLVCGIAGSIASVMWHPATVSVGASGAIMGALGVLIGLNLLEKGKAKNRSQRKGLMQMALFIVGYNLLMGFVMGGVDNAAHLGGLACGLILGSLLSFLPDKKERPKKAEKGDSKPLGTGSFTDA